MSIRSAVATASAPTPLPTSGTWSIDPFHSTLMFSVVHHQVSTFRGCFVNPAGHYDGASETLVGEVAVKDMGAINEILVKTLLGPGFLNAEEYPKFTFGSTKITKDGETLAVQGEMTLHGITRPVTGVGIYHPQRTVQDGRGVTAERFGIDLTTTIDRRDFEISFNNFIAEGVANLGWLVTIDAALEFVEDADQ